MPEAIFVFIIFLLLWPSVYLQTGVPFSRDRESQRRALENRTPKPGTHNTSGNRTHIARRLKYPATDCAPNDEKLS